MNINTNELINRLGIIATMDTVECHFLHIFKEKNGHRIKKLFIAHICITIFGCSQWRDDTF